MLSPSFTSFCHIPGSGQVHPTSPDLVSFGMVSVNCKTKASDQLRVGSGHIILIRHMQGIRKTETCPCSKTSPPQRANSTSVWHRTQHKHAQRGCTGSARAKPCHVNSNGVTAEGASVANSSLGKCPSCCSSWGENEAQKREEANRVEEKTPRSPQQLRGGAKLWYLHWDNR